MKDLIVESSQKVCSHSRHLTQHSGYKWSESETLEVNQSIRCSSIIPGSLPETAILVSRAFILLISPSMMQKWGGSTHLVSALVWASRIPTDKGFSICWSSPAPLLDPSWWLALPSGAPMLPSTGPVAKVISRPGLIGTVDTSRAVDLLPVSFRFRKSLLTNIGWILFWDWLDDVQGLYTIYFSTYTPV